MAYDSATDTALASQAYQRALATAQQRRDQLNTRYGLNADGSMNTTAAGQLGDVYQSGLAGSESEMSAEQADRRRGFAGVGGLAGKLGARARQGALTGQARVLQGAASDLGGVTQDEQAAGQQYESDKSNIGTKSAFDLATTLAANPIYGATPAAAAAGPFAPGSGAISPAQAAAQRAALKYNPRAAQVAKNNRF